MKKIEKLTVEQESKLEVYKDKWLKIGLDTGETDKEEAEKWINKAYEVAGLKPPSKIVWADSPMGCMRS